MTLSKIAPLAFAALTACSDGEDADQPQVVAQSEPSAECYVYSEDPVMPRAFVPDKDMAYFGKIITAVYEGYSDRPADDAPFKADPNYKNLEARFIAEAERVTALTKSVGGVCHLPESELPFGSFGLPGKLGEIILQRDVFLHIYYPQGNGEAMDEPHYNAAWVVELNGGDCELDSVPTISRFVTPDAFPSASEADMAAARTQLDAIEAKMTTLCRQAQGVDLEQPDMTADSFAPARELHKRGEIILGLLSQEEQDRLFTLWAETTHASTRFTELDVERFVTSEFLVSKTLGESANCDGHGERCGTLTCSAGATMSGGYDRDQWSGAMTYCEKDVDAEPVTMSRWGIAEEAFPGRKYEVSMSENSRFVRAGSDLDL